MASLVLFIAYSIALTLFADNKMLTSSRLWKCHKYKTPRQQHISSYQKHHVLRPLTGRIYHFTLPIFYLEFSIKPPTVFYMLQEVTKSIIAFTVTRPTKPTSLRVEATTSQYCAGSNYYLILTILCL